MSDKNIEMMKKLIEEKKQKGMQRENTLRPDKTIGWARKAIRTHKSGGVFDK